MTYVDCPDKKEKHVHYENRINKLDKHYFFLTKDIHKLRKRSSKKKIIKSFTRIAICLNGKTIDDIPVESLDRVCFLLINDYDKVKYSELGMGPLNDGYLFAITQYRLDYNVFYLYNPKNEEYLPFLQYFMQKVKKDLTVFYTGCTSDGNQGILFSPETVVPKDAIADVIASNCNGKAHYVFINDCTSGGSIFDIPLVIKHNKPIKNLLSFSVEKDGTPESKQGRRSHGLLTFYFCKAINDRPDITPNDLIEQMNQDLRRFKIKFNCAITDQELANAPIFYTE